MKIKIEKKAVGPFSDGRLSVEFNEVLRAIERMKEGESFYVHKKPPSNWNIAIRCAERWMGKKFSMRKDGNGYRIYCVEIKKALNK